MASLMKFQYSSYTLEFLAGGDYPAPKRISLLQVQDRTAGGTLQIETLGVTVKQRTIVFTLMSKVDYDALENWFLQVVVGGSNTFQFTDEHGITTNVKIVDTELNFSEIAFELFSGSITLEFV